MLENFEIVSKSIADPSRVRIVKLLEQGELCVCQITAVLALSAATISKHLSILKNAGLLQQRRDGKWVYYRLAGRELNPYAKPSLALISLIPSDDPTLADDLGRLKRVNAVPLQELCEQGLPPEPTCCGTSR